MELGNDTSTTSHHHQHHHHYQYHYHDWNISQESVLGFTHFHWSRSVVQTHRHNTGISKRTTTTTDRISIGNLHAGVNVGVAAANLTREG